MPRQSKPYFRQKTQSWYCSINRFPVVLVGTDYWSPLVDWLRTSVRAKGCIEDNDLQQFKVMDDPQEISDWLDRVVT